MQIGCVLRCQYVGKTKKSYGRSRSTKENILDTGFGCSRVVTTNGNDGVKTVRSNLQRNINGNQFNGAGHQHESKRTQGKKQEIIRPLIVFNRWS